jgi:hypothetical protein
MLLTLAANSSRSGRFCQISRKADPGACDTVQVAEQGRTVAGELLEAERVSVAYTARDRDRSAGERLVERRRGLVIEPHFAVPRECVSTPVAARQTPDPASREVNAPTGLEQLLGGLASRLTAAHDKHSASPKRRRTRRRRDRAWRSNSPQPGPRYVVSSASSSATSRPSRRASSQRRSAKNASVATVGASRRCASRKPTSAAGLPHRRTRRRTPPPSPASPTSLRRSSRPRAPSRQRDSSACSSRRSASTTAAGSSLPTVSQRRWFAQCLLSGRYWARTSDPQLVGLVQQR